MCKLSHRDGSSNVHGRRAQGVDVRRGRREGGMAELVAIPPSEWQPRQFVVEALVHIDNRTASVLCVGGVFSLASGSSHSSRR